MIDINTLRVGDLVAWESFLSDGGNVASIVAFPRRVPVGTLWVLRSAAGCTFGDDRLPSSLRRPTEAEAEAFLAALVHG